MPTPADIYLRFLKYAEAVHGLPSLPPLDPVEERILGLIGRAFGAQERLSVRDMMGKREIGSPGMLHCRLKTMRDKGWIVFHDTEDSRRKQIGPTEKALAHFARMSQCVVNAATHKQL
jgi:hypothetical protein